MGEGKAQTKDENHACKVMGDFSFCPEEKILYPLKRERVEGILIPAKASWHLTDGQSRGQEIFSQRSGVRPDVQAGK